MLRRLINFFRSIMFCFKTKNPLKRRPRILGKISLRTKKCHIVLGKNVTIYPNVVFWGAGTIQIGSNVAIGDNVIILAKKGVFIGNDTMIAANCYIIDCNHGTKELDRLMREQEMDVSEIYIGNNCWVCAGCVIGKGSSLGDGCVVGAMSFLNNNYSTYSNYIIAGQPAKPIKKRGENCE